MADNQVLTSEKPDHRKRRRLLDAAAVASIMPVDPEALAFQHSIFCQTGLPYRNPGPGVREWEQVNGRASLKMLAGEALDPKSMRWVPLGLPFGVKPRLILIYLASEAVRTGSPAVEVGDSVTAFTTRLLKRPPIGPDIRLIKQQLAALAAATIKIGFARSEDRATMLAAHIVEKFDIWLPKDERQRVMWPTTIRLSHEFFISLKDHAVPLDERAVAALSTSCMALDAYCWLAQRLHRVPSGRSLLVPWEALKLQFGWHYDRMDNFKARMRSVLAEVRTEYPDARFDLSHQGMLLHHSPPPIKPRTVLLSKPQDAASDAFPSVDDGGHEGELFT
jgi:Plasmid encoded RepA protein